MRGREDRLYRAPSVELHLAGCFTLEMSQTFSIVEPRSAAETEAFRALNWEYRDFLLALPPPDVEVVRNAYPENKYRTVLEQAGTYNRPPHGMMRLAINQGTAVGCGTIQRLSTEDAEIKRVYIAPAARGLGAGRRIMEHLVADCRTLGFRRILMDTGRLHEAAIALYDDMGFRRHGPYQEMPPEADGIMIYFEMPLH